MKRQNQLNIKHGLLSKLVLLVALFLGSSNAWGGATIFDGTTKTIPGWTVSDMSFKTYSTPYWVYKNGTGGTITSDATILITATQKFVIEAKNYGSKSSEIPKIVVKYSSDNGANYTIANTFSTKETIPSSTSVELETEIVGNYKIQLECDYVYIYSIKIVDVDLYPTPTNFHVTDFTSTSATFEWTKGRDETNWKLAYSTNPDFIPDVNTAISIEDNPYELTELTEETTYYACICSFYGDDHYSGWTEKVSFTPRNETNLTIYNGTHENFLAPINGNRASDITYSQLIIPSSEISSIQGRQITKLTFYAKEENVNWGSAKFEVYLKETSLAAFPGSNYELESWGTNVYSSGSLSVSNNKMEIILDTPFNYSSGNLLIGIKQTVAGTGNTATWYGSETYISGIGLNQYGVYKTRVSYPRKVTFTTTAVSSAPVKLDGNSYTTFASKWPLDLTTANLPSGLKAYKAVVSAGEGKVRFTEINKKVAANTGILLAGTAGNTYRIPVADSGSAVEGGNDFLVNSTGGTFAVVDGYTYFGFMKNSDPITFATFNPSTVAIPSNKAYLKVETSELPTEARQLVAVFDDGETTSLREIRNEELGIKNAVFFNLNGQRVAQPTKGLYIVNGKKVLVP